MGEVYRAKDTRLDRTVAVKILPSHLSENMEARQRFEREARSISSLNHPHICTLHDVGREGGTSYLVMEYVQGETLEARLKKSAMPLKQALECGMQICEALEKAHRAGIVHRDLKPGNIMLTAGGAKLLDFGLAKPSAAMVGARDTGDGGNLTPSTPTMNMSALTAAPGTLTQQGTIVGTFQYMAPEVLQGQEADARSDIFSFGCVLYEMLTGRRAFEGKSQISVASAILDKEPDAISKVQPMAPLALDHVVQECLAKDPESRWQNAADIARELRWVASGQSGVSAAPQLVPQRKLRERALWAAAIALLLALVAWLVLRPHPAERTLRSRLSPPERNIFDFAGDFSGPAVINDQGTAVVYCARGTKEKDSLWVQSLSDLSPVKLDGTEGASFPFWSFDGKNLGFFAEGRLKKIPAGGGPVVTLAEAANARGGAWNQDNVIVFEPDYRDSLWRISASGGLPTRLTKLEVGKHTTHRWPRFLPDGKHFIFFATSHAGGSEQGIYLGSVEDGSYKRVVEADSDAQYASGYLLYHLQSQLLAQKFDPSTGKVSGEPAVLTSLVEYDAGTWRALFTVSQNGLLVYEPGAKTPGVELVWKDRAGNIIGKASEGDAYKGTGRFSPDGKRMAVAVGDPQADIWVVDLARKTRTRLTFGGDSTYLQPSWSADGQKVVFVRQNGPLLSNGTSLHARLANGAGQDEVLMAHGSPEVPTLLAPELSPDGHYLVHVEQGGPVGAGIFALPLVDGKASDEQKPTPIVQPSAQARIVEFRLSPDGRWLAFSSTESGREEIYVTHFPSGTGRWQISQGGAAFPAWRSDSKELYFIGLDGNFYAADVNATTGAFESGQPHSLMSLGSYLAPVGNPYDPFPDGKKFIFAGYPENQTTPLVLVTNWTSDIAK